MRITFEDGDVPETVQVVVNVPGLTELVAELRATIVEIGNQMTELSDAVAAVKVRLEADWAHAQDLIASQAATIADLGGQLTAAMANDAADAAAIAAKQAEVDALVADANAAVGEINAIDLDAAFPPVEPPVEG